MLFEKYLVWLQLISVFPSNHTAKKHFKWFTPVHELATLFRELVSFATIMFCYQQLIIDVRHKLTIMLCFKTYNKFIHIYFQSGAATMIFFFQLWWSIALLSIPVVRFFFCFLLFRSWSMAPLTSDKGAVLGEQSQGWKTHEGRK